MLTERKYVIYNVGKGSERMNDQIIKNMNFRGENISKYGCKNSDAIHLKEDKPDIRSTFFRDIDRIIYSLAYTRYTDKTQVFSFKDNDNISKRMTHVQMVSKIARTIGRALNLNEDLIEAASLGHDLGHVPFGHRGEYILDEISQKNGEGYFNHNIQSVRLLMSLENNGRGSNITLQTLDAIMCHNGEFVKDKYSPQPKSIEDFLVQYTSSYHEKNITKKFVPMTLEGCVVRISDIIAYLGRDIEDAIRLGVFDINLIPQKIQKTLGTSNKEIINKIVLDIIRNSFGQPYIKLSKDIYEAICDLKTFNYKNIYEKAYTKQEENNMKIMFNEMFEQLMTDLKNSNENSPITKHYLSGMSQEYLDNTTNARKIIDYIAGMTDDYFIKVYNWIKEDVKST